jgi:hypothetical protein
VSTTKRTYDLGHNTMIEDDGHMLVARVKSECGGSSSSIRRPVRPGPIKSGETFRLMFSMDRRYYYLPEFAAANGFWLGTKRHTTEEGCKAATPSGFTGPSGYRFVSNNTGKVWYRSKLEFAFWKVAHEPVEAQARFNAEGIDEISDMIIDYASLAQAEDRASEAEFNKQIHRTGWTLHTLLERIGPWVPVPEVPTIKLTNPE